MEIGVYTFAETALAPAASRAVTARDRLRDLMEEIVLADEVGLDVFGVGEHHRAEYVASAPAVVLAAAATRTARIRLTSAVTVLSSADPVRVFQDFATLDLLSGGRAEIMAGRGSFVESFPLFGYDLGDYDALFDERLDLLLALRESEQVTWSGRHRAPLHDRGVYPRPLQDPLPVWVAVGGTPASAARAGARGLPMALAIIGGQPERFAPFAEIHREAARQAGHARPALSINGHGFVADTSQAAADTAYPGFAETMDRIGRERGWAPLTRAVRGFAHAAGRHLRREPGGDRRQDPVPARGVRSRPDAAATDRRPDAAPEGAARDRAARDRGGTGRAARAEGDLAASERRRLPR